MEKLPTPTHPIPDGRLFLKDLPGEDPKENDTARSLHKSDTRGRSDCRAEPVVRILSAREMTN